MQNRFQLIRADKKLMGVCAGIAASTKLDVTLVRVSMVVLAIATFPVVPLLYFFTGWIAPEA